MAARTALIMIGGAVAVGAAAEYLLDPDRGRARRARLAGQAGARSRRAARVGLRKVHYVRGCAVGRWEARRALPVPPADDHELIQKIRSEVLGRVDFHDLDVIVDACDGVVHLRGAVADRSRADALSAAVAGIDGVRTIENFLHAPGAAAPNKIDSLRSSAATRLPVRVPT
jgi:hypothetical protein